MKQPLVALRRMILPIVAMSILAGCVGNTRVDSKPEVVALRTTVEKRPDDPEARMELAEAYLRDFEKTNDPAARDRAIEELSDIHRTHPDYTLAGVHYYEHLSQRAIDTGNYGDVIIAETVYTGTPSLRELPVAPPSFTKAVFKLRRVRDDADVRDVLEALRDVINEKPSFVGARSVLANLYRLDGRHALAIATLQQAIKLDGDSASLHRQLGRSYLARVRSSSCAGEQTDDLKRAVASLRQAIKHAPNEPAAHAVLATAYSYLGRDKLMLFEAKRAQELAKIDRPLWILAYAQAVAGEDVKALENLEKLTEIDPEFFNANRLLAWYHITADNPALALQYSEQYQATTEYGDFFGWVVHSLALRQSENAQAAADYLADIPHTVERTAFAGNINRFLRGQLEEGALVELAGNSCERLEAHFYAGFVRWVDKNDRAGAVAHWEKALATKRSTHVEYAAARRFLNRR